MIAGGNHTFDDRDTPIYFQPSVSKGGIQIEDDVWIGAHSFVMQGIRVGRGAIIGAFSLVNKDVPPYAIVYGSPARVQGFREGAPRQDQEVS